jgi:hypothetical protein
MIEETSAVILRNGELKKVAKARLNGDELEIKTRTIIGEMYKSVDEVTRFFKRKHPGERIEIKSFSDYSKALKTFYSTIR